jgi:hypothetical protein
VLDDALDAVDAVVGVVGEAVDVVDVVDDFPFAKKFSQELLSKEVLLNVSVCWLDQEKESGLNSSRKYLFVKRFTSNTKNVSKDIQ